MSAPDLKVSNKTQCAFKHIANANNAIMMEWCSGTPTWVSDGAKPHKTNATGPKFHRKGGAVEIEWLTDEDKGDEIS